MNKTFTEVLGTYQVPAWALPALINGDYSGLSDSEEQSIEEFASDFNEACNCGDELPAHWSLAGLIFNPIDDAPYFSSRNAIDGLGGEVYDVEVVGNFQSV
jgi:hypothetical protein